MSVALELVTTRGKRILCFIGRCLWTSTCRLGSLFHSCCIARLLSFQPMQDVHLSSKQINFYRHNGYLLIDDVLSDDQLEFWRTTIDTAVSERGKDWVYPQKDQADETNVDLEYYHSVFTQRINLWQSNLKARSLVFEAGNVFGKLACQLEGIERIRIWHDQALYKEAWANPTSWHIDVPYWSFDSVHAISLWVALDDATDSNGCMYFLPGSHRIIKRDYEEKGEFKEIKIGKNMADVFQAFPEARSLPSVAVPMRAGSCSFHSGMLIHGAGANMTARRRRAMTVQMMPDGSCFNGKQNVLTNDQLKSLNIGDILDCEDQNPVLYDTTTTS